MDCQPSPWTPEMNETLKVNRAAGFSFLQCSSIIYQKHGVVFTRNAVIGRASRMGLKSLAKRGAPRDLSKPRRKRLVRHASPGDRINDGALTTLLRAAKKPQQRFRPDTRPIKPDTTESRNMTLLDLGPNQCRYPTSPDDATSHLFCGAQKAEGSSYCEPHAHLCGRPAGGGARPRRYFPTFVPAQSDAVLPHGKTRSEHAGSSS